MNPNAQRSRPAPAFQEYASDMLANSRYKTMSLAERGLMDTMRRECWVNGSIPKESNELAAYLGKPIDEINNNLSTKVLNFFRERNDQLVCPELDAYRASLEEKSKKMSEGGKRGGKAAQDKTKVVKATLEAMLKPLSREELNEDELSGDEKKSLGEGITSQEMARWVADYDNSPDISTAYRIASKGGH
jgi:hypothetical protein